MHIIGGSETQVADKTADLLLPSRAREEGTKVPGVAEKSRDVRLTTQGR